MRYVCKNWWIPYSAFFHLGFLISHLRRGEVCVWEANELFRLRGICLTLIHNKDIMEKINILKRIY